jgi:NADH dehydrogenase
MSQRVVILGGGFAGVNVARGLERVPGFEVSLVNRENYFVFQPLLAEVVSGDLGPTEAIVPIRRLLPRTRLYVREIESVNLSARTVTLAPGMRPKAETLPFDQLVVACGTVTDFRDMPGLQEHALPFKTLADAMRIRNRLIRLVEEAANESDPQARRSLLTMVVAGGGFSGTELAAASFDLLRLLARQTGLDPNEVRVVLVDPGERVLAKELQEKLSRYAHDQLARRGLELRMGTRLLSASPVSAELKSGERIATRTVVSTVPALPNPLLATLGVELVRGKLAVDRHLAVAGHPGVWALGDAAAIPAGENGIHPPTAQHAVREASVLARNIRAAAPGGSGRLQAFEFAGLGKLGALGRHKAVAQLPLGIMLSGFFAWVMWRGIYWAKMPGIDRKVRIAISWLMDLFLPLDTARFGANDSAGILKMHFRPGETVIQAGDFGDYTYVILEGVAEVWSDSRASAVHANGAPLSGGVSGAETPRLLAELGKGEVFGEIAVLESRARTATVKAKSPLTVLAIPRNDFQPLVSNLPGVRESMEELIRERTTDAR